MGLRVGSSSVDVRRPSVTRGRAAAIGGFAIFGAVAWFVGIPCFFHALTGLHCPGCGATRAVKALAQGDVLTALHDNAWMLLIAGPALALHVATWFSTSAMLAKVSHRYLNIAAWTAIGFLILRNIPLAPFNWLAPLP